jgi:hypothetical protein
MCGEHAGEVGPVEILEGGPVELVLRQERAILGAADLVRIEGVAHAGEDAQLLVCQSWRRQECLQLRFLGVRAWDVDVGAAVTPPTEAEELRITVVQHGCGFDPKRIFVSATKMGKLDFVRWFHEQYSQPLSFTMAERLVKAAIFRLSDDNEEMAILKYCLSLWRAQRRASDTATVPSRVLKWAARYDNWRALRWCAEQCASTDLEGLVLECKDYIVQNLKMNE